MSSAVTPFALRRSRGAVMVALSSEAFLTRLGFGIVNFTLPLFALSLGMSITEVGALTAIRSVSAMAVKPLMGRLAERYGAKKVYLAAIAGRVATGLLLALAGGVYWLYLIRTLHGASVAARDPSAATILARGARNESAARSFAWYTTAKDVGGALGYSVAGFAISVTAANYRLVFVAAALTSAIALLVVQAALPADGRRVAKPTATMSSTTKVSAERRSAIMAMAGFGGLAAATSQMLTGLFPILAVHYAHLRADQAGLILTGSALVLLVGGPTFGWVADRRGFKAVLLVRSVANSISAILFLVVPTFAGVAAARFVDDAGKAAFRPTWAAMMTGSRGRRRSPSAVADMDTGYTVGEAVGPLLASWIWDVFGVGPMLVARVALAGLTEVYGWWALRRLGA